MVEKNKEDGNNRLVFSTFALKGFNYQKAESFNVKE